jgi:hypothetical protein
MSEYLYLLAFRGGGAEGILEHPPIAGSKTESHPWRQDCEGPDIHTEDGQLGLPITPEMLLSG